MDPNEALVYIQIGETLYAVARGPVGAVVNWIRNSNTENIQADNDKLDEIDADDQRRIAQAEQEAGLTPKD
jgi:hypothetical protein